MTDKPLPESGPEREIFLKALRSFSDECEPPDLIAECPFSIDLPSGGRGCGEECLELLKRYGVSHVTGGIPIGSSEVTAHSMGRPRRPKSHVNSGKPFDAAECFYRDSDDPDRSTWETASLLYNLRSTYVPPADSLVDSRRSEKLHLAATELRHRGFNVDQLLRCGLRTRLAGAISIATVLPALLSALPAPEEGESEADQTPLQYRPAPVGWPELLDQYLAIKDPPSANASPLMVATHRMMSVLTSEFLARLQLWAATAPVENLIDWRPPSTDEFLAYDLVNESAVKAECRRPRWIIDRFTETYLRDWDTDSLRLEWRYQQHSENPPCPRREMEARLVDTNDLARTLAQATANPVSDKRLEIKSTAVRLLESGRRNTAAAMFDAARQDDWDDPELQNNYGFCLLPDDPSEALKALELAAKFGFSETVNVCNRTLALFRLGRHAAALEVAERAMEKWSELDVEPSLLWDFETSEPKLLRKAQPRLYLLELATHIADMSGNERESARWHDLKSQLER